ncbi:MAG: hypothetical protein IPJ81_12235 [Chitinophagaceae bacterium]|nr:hypothetical protein [Chitinophagaceae bacterium]
MKGSDFNIATAEIPGWEFGSKGSLTVALDIKISDNLKKEGNAREFVNRIQTIRKESNFALTDRIIVQVEQNAIAEESFNQYKTYICAEILADSLEFIPKITVGTEIEVNDAILIVNVLKK